VNPNSWIEVLVDVGDMRRELTKQGKPPPDFGQFWFKGQRMGTGQANVKAYDRFLCELIDQGEAEPSFVVSHELTLDGAPEAYRNIQARLDGWTEAALKP
jgi:glutathione-independent formaldehyde dehydrogenase